jgi:hypothetical protein
MNAGIEMSLQILAREALRDSQNENIRQLARGITAGLRDNQNRMRELVEYLYRATGAGLRTLIDGTIMDADDACRCVASLALAVGIPCRLVAERYNQSWTVRLGYEVDGRWETIDCLNQSTEREPDERVIGKELKR